MKFKLLLILTFSLALFANNAFGGSNWLKSKYKVKKVLTGSSFIVDFNGIGLPVTLTNIKISNEKKSKALLKKLISGKKVTIIPEELAGLTDTGMQQVYAFVKTKGKKIFINKKIIKEKLASYVEGDSKLFKKLLKMLSVASNKNASEASKKARESNQKGFCSELYSKKYHTLSCRWAKKMNLQSRIIYETIASAEKANKKPCNSCLFERVGELRVLKHLARKASVKTEMAEEKKENSSKTNSRPTGSLFGLKGSKFFYSPISKSIAKADPSDLIVYKTVNDAKKAGKKPDSRSLRIGNPVMPQPSGKECVGRALPYLRPCLRKSNHESGLCEPCLNGKIR